MKYFYLFLILFFSSFSFLQTEDNLPLLGDPSSAAISLSGEYDLGRLWLSIFRSSVKEYEDPLTTTYIEDLIYRISETSEVRDRRYEFVVIDDNSINAFAAPGGIIGINKGMFLKTDFESEFASVMCHELAHLSQRHFARSQSQLTALGNALLILGSVAVAAASGSAEGIYLGPALIQQISINYTRNNEKEADRIGFNNLVKAGFDPKGMSSMFQKLQKSRGVNDEEYSYLMSHPLPKERITDAKLRENSIEKKEKYRDSLDFYLIKARSIVSSSNDHRELVKEYEKTLRSNLTEKSIVAAEYGLVLTHKKLKNFPLAFKLLRSLLDQFPNNLILQTTLMELHIAEENNFEAVSVGETLLSLNENNHAISKILSKAYMQNNQIKDAEIILSKLSRNRPMDPSVWYQLAEAQGLSGNILGLHRSRAEYFMLTGRYDAAIFQLREALKLSKNFFEIRESIVNRLEDIFETKKALRELS
tara:strand:+ start:9764 stop:11191 length:1428 start_codon:yes stop_codon:yes gene_type:complete